MRLTATLFVAFAGVTSASAQTLQLEPYWSEEPRLLLAPVEVDGRPARLLFDTGAGITTLTLPFAQSVNCTPYGAVSGFRMRGDRLDIKKCGRMSVRVGDEDAERELGAADFGALLPPTAPPLDGIMGVDALGDRLITLDLADRIIHLDERPGRGWQEGRARIARETGGASLSVFVRVAAPTGDLWMLLDSGHLVPVYLSPGAIEQLGAPSLDAPLRLAITGAGEHDVRAARVETLRYDGVFGEPFMKQFEIAIDLRRERIWWRPAQSSN